MSSSFLLPPTIHLQITQSQTMINNIFSNNIEDDLNSGNLTSTISDHYAQFLLLTLTTPKKLHCRKTPTQLQNLE